MPGPARRSRRTRNEPPEILVSKPEEGHHSGIEDKEQEHSEGEDYREEPEGQTEESFDEGQNEGKGQSKKRDDPFQKSDTVATARRSNRPRKTTYRSSKTSSPAMSNTGKRRGRFANSSDDQRSKDGDDASSGGRSYGEGVSEDGELKHQEPRVLPQRAKRARLTSTPNRFHEESKEEDTSQRGNEWGAGATDEDDKESWGDISYGILVPEDKTFKVAEDEDEHSSDNEPLSILMKRKKETLKKTRAKAKISPSTGSSNGDDQSEEEPTKKSFNSATSSAIDEDEEIEGSNNETSKPKQLRTRQRRKTQARVKKKGSTNRTSGDEGDNDEPFSRTKRKRRRQNHSTTKATSVASTNDEESSDESVKNEKRSTRSGQSRSEKTSWPISPSNDEHVEDTNIDDEEKNGLTGTSNERRLLHESEEKNDNNNDDKKEPRAKRLARSRSNSHADDEASTGEKIVDAQSARRSQRKRRKPHKLGENESSDEGYSVKGEKSEVKQFVDKETEFEEKLKKNSALSEAVPWKIVASAEQDYPPSKMQTKGEGCSDRLESEKVGEMNDAVLQGNSGADDAKVAASREHRASKQGNEISEGTKQGSSCRNSEQTLTKTYSDINNDVIDDKDENEESNSHTYKPLDASIKGDDNDFSGETSSLSGKDGDYQSKLKTVAYNNTAKDNDPVGDPAAVTANPEDQELDATYANTTNDANDQHKSEPTAQLDVTGEYCSIPEKSSAEMQFKSHLASTNATECGISQSSDEQKISLPGDVIVMKDDPIDATTATKSDERQLSGSSVFQKHIENSRQQDDEADISTRIDVTSDPIGTERLPVELSGKYRLLTNDRTNVMDTNRPTLHTSPCLQHEAPMASEENEGESECGKLQTHKVYPIKNSISPAEPARALRLNSDAGSETPHGQPVDVNFGATDEAGDFCADDQVESKIPQGRCMQENEIDSTRKQTQNPEKDRDNEEDTVHDAQMEFPSEHISKENTLSFQIQTPRTKAAEDQSKHQVEISVRSAIEIVASIDASTETREQVVSAKGIISSPIENEGFSHANMSKLENTTSPNLSEIPDKNNSDARDSNEPIQLSPNETQHTCQVVIGPKRPIEDVARPSPSHGHSGQDNVGTDTGNGVIVTGKSSIVKQCVSGAGSSGTSMEGLDGELSMSVNASSHVAVPPDCLSGANFTETAGSSDNAIREENNLKVSSTSFSIMIGPTTSVLQSGTKSMTKGSGKNVTGIRDSPLSSDPPAQGPFAAGANPYQYSIINSQQDDPKTAYSLTAVRIANSNNPQAFPPMSGTEASSASDSTISRLSVAQTPTNISAMTVDLPSKAHMDDVKHNISRNVARYADLTPQLRSLPFDLEYAVKFGPSPPVLRKSSNATPTFPINHAETDKLRRLKTILFVNGSKVHRGTGFERIFAEYWDAMALRLSERLSSHTSERCQKAIDNFLKTSKLRKIHNKFVISIMRHATRSITTYDEISPHLPVQWRERISRIVEKQSDSSTKRQVNTVLSIPTFLSKSTESVYREAWDHHQTDRKPSGNESRREKTLLAPKLEVASSNIPGALMVDPLVRKIADDTEMEVSELAVWMMVVAVKEHATNILKAALAQKEGMEQQELAPRILSFPNLLASSTKLPSKKDPSHEVSMPSLAERGTSTSKQLTVMDVYAGLSAMPYGNICSLGGSVSRNVLERSLHAAYDHIPVLPKDDFIQVQHFITDQIFVEARTRDVPAKTRDDERAVRALDNDQATEAAIKQQDSFAVPPPVRAQSRKVETSVPPHPQAPIKPLAVQLSLPNTLHDANPTPSDCDDSQKSVPRGMGRAAKDLAALIQRTSILTQPEDEKTLSESDAYNGELRISTPNENNTLATEESFNTSLEADDETGQRRGKGFGIKNLAALRARAGTKDSDPPPLPLNFD